MQFNELQEYYLQRRRTGAQSLRQEERDIVAMNREGYHAGLQNFQSVLTTFTRYRCGYLLWGHNMLSSSISVAIELIIFISCLLSCLLQSSTCHRGTKAWRLVSLCQYCIKVSSLKHTPSTLQSHARNSFVSVLSDLTSSRANAA